MERNWKLNSNCTEWHKGRKENFPLTWATRLTGHGSSSDAELAKITVTFCKSPPEDLRLHTLLLLLLPARRLSFNGLLIVSPCLVLVLVPRTHSTRFTFGHVYGSFGLFLTRTHAVYDQDDAPLSSRCWTGTLTLNSNLRRCCLWSAPTGSTAASNASLPDLNLITGLISLGSWRKPLPPLSGPGLGGPGAKPERWRSTGWNRGRGEITSPSVVVLCRLFQARRGNEVARSNSEYNLSGCPLAGQGFIHVL